MNITMRKIVSLSPSYSPVSITEIGADRMLLPSSLNIPGYDPFPVVFEWPADDRFAAKALPSSIDRIQANVLDRFRGSGVLGERAEDGKPTRSEKRFERSLFAHLVGYTCPNDSEPAIELVVDHVAHLFMLDNFFDEPTMMIRSGETLDPRMVTDTLYQSLVNGLTGGGSDGGEIHPYVRALSELNQGIGARVNTKISGRAGGGEPFLFRYNEYLSAICAETKFRSSGIWRSPEGYATMRAKTSAVVDVLELIWLVNGISLEPKVRIDEEFTGMIHNCNRHVSYVNDLFSLANEIQEDTRENMVLVEYHWQVESTRDLGKAIQSTVTRVNQAVADFVILYNSYFSDPRNHQDTPQRKAIQYAIDLMIGNLEWSKETGRYRPE